MTASSQDPSADQTSNELPKVSPKQKKEEILSAYQELLDRFKNNAEKVKDREKDLTRKQESSVLSKANQYSTESILKKIGELELATHEWLGKLVEALSKEVQKFRELQEAVTIEEQRLKEVHQVGVEANALTDLIEAQKEKTLEFEEEIKAKRKLWESEQKDFEYERSVLRRKEEDEYEEKRGAKERELKAWEDRLKETEAELKELRMSKEQSKKTLEEDTEKARTEGMESVKKEEMVKAQLLAEKTNSERQISEHTLKYLKDRLAEQESTITRLKNELTSANQGVKDIAIKVIEGGVRLDDQHRNVKLPTREKPAVEEVI